MSEPLEWHPDGTPHSLRFGDRYHSSAQHGLAQARGSFLQGCGLPEAWRGKAQWRVLETGFGFGLNFLVTWAAWRADAARPRLLHFVSCEAWPVQADELAALAQQLAAQWWGLLPGVHRLSFEQGQVLLTLYIGDAQTLLRQHKPPADSIYLDGFSPACNPEMWNLHTLKAVARCCSRGTRLATWCVARSVRDALTQNGFVVRKVAGMPPKQHNLQAVFEPTWQPRLGRPMLPDVALPHAGRCCIIGSGLAGASTAASLARRGWQVEVLEQGSAPAAGASGLPAGIFAPHVSPDDCLLSRLSRSGVRTMLQWLADVAGDARGSIWNDCGVLEHRPTRLPWTKDAGLDWSRPAHAVQCTANHLPEDAAACWHARAGWVRPTHLIERLLAQPGIVWRGACTVAQLRHRAGAWQALDAQGQVVATADMLVVCSGSHSNALLAQDLPLQPLRGQVTWGLHTPFSPDLPWPAQALNGDGNLLPAVPLDTGCGWVFGSTFERDATALPLSPEEVAVGHAANIAKLHRLAPTLGQALFPQNQRIQRMYPHLPGEEGGEPVHIHHWAGVRCATPDRLPLVGPLATGLWVCTGMGARGLTLAALCAELLAARLHGEPLPLPVTLAQALGSERFARNR